MEKSSRTALVLGANGFLGNAVAQAFVLAGYKTYGLIRNEKNSSTLALQEIIPVIGDVIDLAWVDKLGPVDVIVNATQDMKNFDAWTNSLQAIPTKLGKAHNRKPLLIFTSGITVFGDTGRESDPDFQSVNEESVQVPLKISAFRAALIEKLMASQDFHTAVVIPGMLYGRSHSLYGIYLGQAAKGNKIVTHGKPDTVWHGVHVDDCADVYVRIANLGDRAFKQSYLAANDKYELMDNILKAISSQFGGQHEIVYEAPGEDIISLFESTSTAVDNGKIRRELGWVQRRPNFADGIEQYAVSWKAAQAAGGDNLGNH